MQSLLYRIIGLAAMLPLASPGGTGQTSGKQSIANGEQVTIEGCLLCDWVTLPHPKTSYGPPPLDPEHVFAVYAIDGTPEIRATLERIVAECIPEKGLGGDAAQAMQEEFTRRLKYYVSPDSPVLNDMLKKLHSYECHGNPYALTGILSEQHGRKWINVRKHVSLPD